MFKYGFGNKIVLSTAKRTFFNRSLKTARINIAVRHRSFSVRKIKRFNTFDIKCVNNAVPSVDKIVSPRFRSIAFGFDETRRASDLEAVLLEYIVDFNDIIRRQTQAADKVSFYEFV